MLSSQVLETGIGIAFLLFVLATAASAFLELVRRLLNSRSKDLEAALKSFLAGSPGEGGVKRALTHLVQTVGAPKLDDSAARAWDSFKETSVYQGAVAARGQVRPAYMSAKSFAEAVEEQLRGGAQLTGPLGKRVAVLEESVGNDAVAFRAGLERWFDEAMAGLSSRYRKRSAVWLFVLGLVLCGALNASVPHVAQELWRNSATRTAVVAAAEGSGQSTTTGTDETLAETIESVADKADQLSQLGIPIGWGEESSGDAVWALRILGWILTAALISLGAPFWFDLLGRMTAMRSPKPTLAADDKTSATVLSADIASRNQAANSGQPYP
ncbi:hypothetical protein MLP_34460 [Microlunatus phosphovorus NM-1]|uniref:Uncharacterized protein n=1 Tax=Microlunatus phosphovorus (strain ATCC 700054 / DSM 10555 / JCM 9379 / NBRC 101784 / NCIMB 13414 / VKM Ac-1990 / NM-1) TaxID=1032480 RepID=F5XN10_MICPN|nr:hypothetical protein [Microlunatus phosphovorus]BAK36460.1 hypothetical protein MLP_34460 [Microlunatus phosphovorus NM-1]